MGDVLNMDELGTKVQNWRRARGVLRAGGAVVLPTDSVYGIACLATENNPGHERIFAIKHRDRAQTLPLLVGEISDLERLGASLPDTAHELAQAFWPGALTIVVQASSAVPADYVHADGTIALRMPASALVLGLIRQLGLPLATTSANLHGRPPARRTSELDPVIVTEADLTLTGEPEPAGTPSTIVVCSGSSVRITREGAVSRAQLEEVCHGGVD